MRIIAFSALALGLGIVSVQLAACSNSSDDCNATATCGATSGTSSGGSAGKSGSGSGNEGGELGGGSSGGSQNVSGTSGTSGSLGIGGEGGTPTGCSGEISEDTECWATNELGVFVSSESGDDATGDGTKEKPFASITKGVSASGGKNVYVCLGATKDTYAEKVTLSKATDGIHIYGGFACEDWSYSTTRSSAVVSPENIALRIQSVVKGAYIENVRFTAANASGTGFEASSYGAFVTDSKNVVLKRVELTAGAGLKGSDESQPEKAPDGAEAKAAQVGEAAACGGTPADGLPGRWPAQVCGSKGGNGGIGSTNSDGASGFSGVPGQNVTPPDVKNLGAGATDGTHGGDGDDGSPGNAGALPPAGPGQGTFAATGFTPAAGADGGNGFPGQGGGGGGASKGSPTCRGASGGAGGMGGCGGTGGKGGKGGGASVGLFSWSSDVVLSASTVTSKEGGAGGKGGDGGYGGLGAPGGAGGGAFPGNSPSRGGNGGNGGGGGNGASGAGGSGGPSVAIVYSGTKPLYDDLTSLVEGKPGPAGPGGVLLNAQAPNGSVGASLEELEVK